jgi:serine/threonine protein kinase
VSPEAKDLINGLLHKDRFQRMKLEEVLSHPWICKRSKDIADLRRKSDGADKFNLYTATLASHIEKSPTRKL